MISGMAATHQQGGVPLAPLAVVNGISGVLPPSAQVDHTLSAGSWIRLCPVRCCQGVGSRAVTQWRAHMTGPMLALPVQQRPDSWSFVAGLPP